MLTATLFAGCGAETIDNRAETAGHTQAQVSDERALSAEDNDSTAETQTDSEAAETDTAENLIPDEIQTIPAAYFEPAQNQGTLVELTYDTYESFSYDEKTRKLTKRAIVYLPYGYSQEEKYNVFYLMHGGWSNETTTLGIPGAESAFKNVLDHMIEAGETKPLIVVCPTYNNTNENGQDSDSFSLAMQLTRNFHSELVNDLLPAVEGTYRTYAEDVTEEALMASRDHRGFGGFSMGSVTTWRTFEYCMDYFRYYLPMSCGTSLDDEEIWKGADGHEAEDYFVWIMTGTQDFAYSYDENRAKKMRDSDYFIESDSEAGGNFAYRVKTGYSHDGGAAMEYTYNGMRFFWGKKKGGETSGDARDAQMNEPIKEFYTTRTSISDVINDPVFVTASGEAYGRLLFPANKNYYSGSTLGDLSLTWYGNLQPEATVEIANYMKSYAQAGETVFYDIYTDEEKEADPAKKDTGLFFFKGSPGEKFAICNAGGGFAYVGAMHDSFPHAMELSKKGYNAFALIYRPGAQTACEDLARAIAFIHEHAEKLEVDTEGYSLWGGSAGARMAAWLGSYGTEGFGEEAYPRPAAVIMQYTGLSEVYGNEPPTYNCVGTNDGIASYRTMQARIDAIKANGTDAEIEVFQGLSHGFGLGTGTVAEGWIDRAVIFWERNMEDQ